MIAAHISIMATTCDFDDICVAPAFIVPRRRCVGIKVKGGYHCESHAMGLEKFKRQHDNTNEAIEMFRRGATSKRQQPMFELLSLYDLYKTLYFNANAVRTRFYMHDLYDVASGFDIRDDEAYACENMIVSRLIAEYGTEVMERYVRGDCASGPCVALLEVFIRIYNERYDHLELASIYMSNHMLRMREKETLLKLARNRISSRLAEYGMNADESANVKLYYPAHNGRMWRPDGNMWMKVDEGKPFHEIEMYITHYIVVSSMMFWFFNYCGRQQHRKMNDAPYYLMDMPYLFNLECAPDVISMELLADFYRFLLYEKRGIPRAVEIIRAAKQVPLRLIVMYDRKIYHLVGIPQDMWHNIVGSKKYNLCERLKH